MSRRVSITLTDEQYERLLRESERSGFGVAELVRRALERMYGRGVYGSGRRDELKQALEATFGIWADRDFDGEEYVERMRRGVGEPFRDR